MTEFGFHVWLALLCALVIVMRTVCVIGTHMSSRTKRWVKWIYSLQAAGATILFMAFAMRWLAWAPGVVDDFTSTGALLLLAGSAASHLRDKRIFPPRSIRADWARWRSEP